MRVGFCRGELPFQLNGLFKSDNSHGILEVKFIHSIDIVLPATSEAVDKVTGYTKDGGLTKVNSLYSELVGEKHGRRKSILGKLNECMAWLKQGAAELKERIVCVFENFCESGLFRIIFHILDHILENLDRFESVRFLGISVYENSIVVLKRMYQRTSMKNQAECKKILVHWI